MPENREYGIRRGIVLDNDDPERMGRCKVFVPGVYPREFFNRPAMLPWAEPAMGVFGGGWTSRIGSANEESGTCSVPHAGKDGDGAQVWVFFNDGDVRFPVYFAVCQSGPGWFSRHPNQHVIQTDNVKVVVDEYDGYVSDGSGEDQVSDSLASEVSSLSPSVFKAMLERAGGVGQVRSMYDSMGGAGSFYSFMASCGGPDGLRQVSSRCMSGMVSLASFISQCGGSGGFSSLMEECGGIESFANYSAQARKALAARFGSVQEFDGMLNQVGGLDGILSIVGRFTTLDGFVSAVSSVNDVAGLEAMGRLEASIGGAEPFSSWNSSFRDGASSVYQLFSGKDAEDSLADLQSGKSGKSNVTLSDTNTSDAGRNDPFISQATRRGVRTRMRVEVTVPKGDIGVDLVVHGDVNVMVDGNLYREVRGNVYETYLGDHHVYHRGGYAEFSDGSHYREVDGNVQEVTRGREVRMLMGGTDQTVLKDSRIDVVDASWSVSATSVNVEASNVVDVQCHDLNQTASGGFNLIGHGNSSIRVDGLLGVLSNAVDVNATTKASITAQVLRLFGSVLSSLKSDTSVLIATSPAAKAGVVPTVSVSTTSLTMAASLKAAMNFFGSLVRKVKGSFVSDVVGSVEKTVGGNFSEITAGNSVRTVAGQSTDVVTGAYSLTAASAGLEAKTGLLSLEATAGAIEQTAGSTVSVTAAGLISQASVAGFKFTGSGGSFSLNGSTGSDTSSGTGGSFPKVV